MAALVVLGSRKMPRISSSATKQYLRLLHFYGIHSVLLPGGSGGSLPDLSCIVLQPADQMSCYADQKRALMAYERED